MSDARADALLKSALEKIVYFEARSEQLQSELATARADAMRFKQELVQAAQREMGLRRQIAELEVTAERNHREREELGRIADALRAERNGWMEKLIDSARIQATGSDMEGLDLASFIATLRSEVIAGRKVGGGAELPLPFVAEKPAVVVSERAAPPPTLPADSDSPKGDRLQQEAERYFQQGRLAASQNDVLALAQPKGATERTLFGFSVRELSSPDAGSRIRAAERLKALADRAAAPALATALHAERDPKAQVALLHAFSALATQEGAEIVLPLLTGSDPEVRIAALKALLALDPQRAAPQLSAASRDPDPWVRRRASLLALGRPREEAVRLSEAAAHDGDPDVRRLTTLALGAAGQDQARAQLLEALTDSAPAVRAAAASSLGRMLGQDVRYVLSMDAVQRRREIRKLAALPLAPVRRLAPTATSTVAPVASAQGSGLPATSASDAAQGESGLQTMTAMHEAPAFAWALAPTRAGTAHAGAPVAQNPLVSAPPMPFSAPAPASFMPTPAAAAPAPPPGALAQGPAATRGTAGSAPLSVMTAATPGPAAMLNPAAAGASSEAFAAAVLLELRSAIRGRTLQDLAAVGLSDSATLSESLTLLIARGQVVRRGSKFFVA